MKTLRQIREEKPVWDKPNPVKNHSKLSSSDKARARARAKAAGRPYPNMVDNIWAARNESSLEDRVKKYIRPVVKTTPKIEKVTEPAGRTTDHVEWKVTGPSGEVRRFKSKQEAEAHHRSFSEAAPAWTRKEGKSPSGGLNAKGIASYRRENPGSKLKMAVTTPPSKLDPNGKAAKRRKSFCARMGGSKGPMKDEHGKPTRKALALRKWNC